MDRLQYVYSSSETSDEELESADTALAPKDPSTTVSGSSKKAGNPRGYSPASIDSESPSGTRSSSEKRHSPDSVKRRSYSRGRSPDTRKDRHSPPYRQRSKDRRRSRDKEHRDRDRERDRRRHRSRERSKDRRRNKSRERRYDRRSRSRSSRRSYGSPKRKDRSRSPHPPPRKHFDPKNKLVLLNRMGIDYKGTESVDFPNKQHCAGASSAGANAGVPEYYNPLTINAGKYAEQIAKRKMLWNNKKTEKPEATAGNIWQGAKFSQDNDGKMAAKFQRLMGMKDGAPPGTGKGQELIKKQEELFSTMEMQYEVARATTHTQRGVGLGFGPRHIP